MDLFVDAPRNKNRSKTQLSTIEEDGSNYFPRGEGKRLPPANATDVTVRSSGASHRDSRLDPPPDPEYPSNLD